GPLKREILHFFLQTSSFRLQVAWLFSNLIRSPVRELFEDANELVLGIEVDFDSSSGSSSDDPHGRAKSEAQALFGSPGESVHGLRWRCRGGSPRLRDVFP